MGFFSAIKGDVVAIARKIDSAFHNQALSGVEAEIKTDLLGVVNRLITYVESKLPEIEAAAAGAVATAAGVVERAIPGLAPVVAAAEPLIAGAATSGIARAGAAVASLPKAPLPGTGTHPGCTVANPCPTHGGGVAVAPTPTPPLPVVIPPPPAPTTGPTHTGGTNPGAPVVPPPADPTAPTG